MKYVAKIDNPPFIEQTIQHNEQPNNQASSNDPQEDSILVDIAKRDHTAFSALYRKYVKLVYRYFYHRVGNVQDAEDLTSDTFSKALTSLASYRGESSFRVWLFGIARHTMLDYQRIRHPYSHRDMALAISPLADSTSQPDDRLIRAELLSVLSLWIQELPDEQREALLLRIFGGLSVRDTASVLDKSEAAVKMLVYRAMSTLKLRYTRDYNREI